MRNNYFVIIFILTILSSIYPSRPIFADTVYLKSGKKINGAIQEIREKSVIITSFEIGTIEINRTMIRTIVAGDEDVIDKPKVLDRPPIKHQPALEPLNKILPLDEGEGAPITKKLLENKPPTVVPKEVENLKQKNDEDNALDLWFMSFSYGPAYVVASRGEKPFLDGVYGLNQVAYGYNWDAIGYRFFDFFSLSLNEQNIKFNSAQQNDQNYSRKFNAFGLKAAFAYSASLSEKIDSRLSVVYVRTKSTLEIRKESDVVGKYVEQSYHGKGESISFDLDIVHADSLIGFASGVRIGQHRLYSSEVYTEPTIESPNYIKLTAGHAYLGASLNW